MHNAHDSSVIELQGALGEKNSPPVDIIRQSVFLDCPRRFSWLSFLDLP
jgi:hypothetical protein